MQRGGQNSDANDTALLWGPVVGAILILVLWYFFKAQIVHGIFFIKNLELAFVTAILEPITSILKVLHLPAPNFVKMRMIKGLINPRNLDLKDVTLSNFMSVISFVGVYFRFITIPLLALMAAALVFLPSAQRFRNTYSMKNLRKLEAKNWPQITPVLSLDLVKQDITKGPWAMALNPIDFCFKHKIIDKKEAKATGKLTVAQGVANKVFVMQLGAPFTGIRNTPIHVRAIFVIFAAAASYDRKEMERVIRQISASAADTGHLDFTGIDELVAKYENQKFIQWLNPRHAYLTTWLSSLLILARNSGVVATSEFLWLKAVDRRLWYTLNTVGRNTPFTEVAGVYAHWLAERRVGRALKTPMVKQAILGLEKAMAEIAFTSEESEWQDSVA